MKIHEVTNDEGTLVPVELRASEGGFVLATGARVEPLPDGAVPAVMNRFGKPLDADVELVEVAALDLGDGRLRHVRHLARYDVIARDFLVLEFEGQEPLCALATNVAGALAHLAKLTSSPGRT